MRGTGAGYRPVVTSPLGSFLCPPGFAGPTGLRALAREGSAVTEAARFVRRSAGRRLRRERVPRPVADGSPVLLVPGFLAGDGSLALLSSHLRSQGHRTYRSRIHANVGCSQDALEALERRVEAVSLARASSVTIVGHSLGGLLARALAARRPDLVDGIVTLGSPVLAPGAAHPVLLFDLAVITRLQRVTVGGFTLGGFLGEDCTSGDCARRSWEQARLPLPESVAFTSVFSRRDGVVDWRSCLDPAARSVEVTTSHLGMAFDPAVLDVVSSTLAAVSRRARWTAAPDATAG